VTEERLDQRSLTAAECEDFGRRLALTHAAGAPVFGAGPPGWTGTGWIGQARLPLGSYATWGEFYAELRVLPYVHQAHAAGRLTTSEATRLERVCQRLRDGAYDDARPPARIHGDLWSGNVMANRDGAVLIDPAAHGGAGETDLAMLALFGFPGLPRVQAAYAEAAGLDSGWPERIALHQLHPLLVHTVLFGRSYASQAMAAARRIG
jgi:fructosamine-3-kinase